MIAGRHVTVIIPALDEEKAITRVIEDIPEFVDQIIVVDNDSKDRTAAEAQRAGAKVVSEPAKGYGIACASGIREAGDTDIFAFVDGGRRDYPADLLKLIEPIATDQYELAIGVRREIHQSRRGRLPHQRWGTWLACRCIRWLYGVRFDDLGPMRSIGKGALERLEMKDENYDWTAEMQIKAFKLGMRILQVPVRYRRRIGKSKISGTLRGSAAAGFKIFYWIFRLAFASKAPTNS